MSVLIDETDRKVEALNHKVEDLNYRIASLEHMHQFLLEISQERWKGSEPDANLTWGEIFTGDSFIDAVEEFYKFDETGHICEVGPGYGRLLATLLDRRLPFSRYTAVELSPERVRTLRQKFADPRVEFILGDVNKIQLDGKPDLLICSSTFEHLFPDFSMALSNISNHLKPNACVAIDFIQADLRMEHRQQGFEANGHAFVRIYSKEEIHSLFERCGLTDLHMRSITLGKVSYGDINRIFAFARRKKIVM